MKRSHANTSRLTAEERTTALMRDLGLASARDRSLIMKAIQDAVRSAQARAKRRTP